MFSREIGAQSAARDDWSLLPVEARADARYIITDGSVEQYEAMRFALNSCSRQPNSQACLPIQLSPTEFRIQLSSLLWSQSDWDKHIGLRYPYSPNYGALQSMFRLDWLLLQLFDQTENENAYLSLLFGRIPKNRDDALNIFNVSPDPSLKFGVIPLTSQVAKQNVRWVENRPVLRGYCWGTRDSAQTGNESDPLEHPDGNFKHLGEEWILGIPKYDPVTQQRGAVQAYFLANGDGALVQRAPVELVEDYNKFRGYAEIRNPGSCIGCHQQGLNQLDESQLVQTLKLGVPLNAATTHYGQLENFHFSDLTTEISRNNEDYKRFVTNGPERVLAVINAYDKPLNLSACAAELKTTSIELSRVIGSYPAVSARVAALTAGGTISRDAWEQYYPTLRSIIDGKPVVIAPASK